MTDSTSNPRRIPEPTKRTVRQRCGFGCIVCGLPLYAYHHIVDWALVKKHTAENITLLCGFHHHEATNGLLTSEQVRSANERPINISRGISSPYGLRFELDEHRTFHAVIGGNWFSTSAQTDTSFISVDDTDLVWARIDEHGQVFLHMNVFDEFNNCALQVVGNELVYASSLWDITFTGKKLTLREEKRALLLEISFLPPSMILINRGCLILNGLEIIILPELIYSGGLVFSSMIVHNCLAGLVVGRNIRRLNGAFRWADVPRFTSDERKQNKQEAKRRRAELRKIDATKKAGAVDQ